MVEKEDDEFTGFKTRNYKDDDIKRYEKRHYKSLKLPVILLILVLLYLVVKGMI